jgi:hypothetical protein
MSVFRNRLLKKKFWHRNGETNGDWRRLRNGDLHEVHFSSSLICVIKPRRMRKDGHVKRNRGMRYGCRVFGGETLEKGINCKTWV